MLAGKLRESLHMTGRYCTIIPVDSGADFLRNDSLAAVKNAHTKIKTPLLQCKLHNINA